MAWGWKGRSVRPEEPTPAPPRPGGMAHYGIGDGQIRRQRVKREGHSVREEGTRRSSRLPSSGMSSAHRAAAVWQRHPQPQGAPVDKHANSSQSSCRHRHTNPAREMAPHIRCQWLSCPHTIARPHVVRRAVVRDPFLVLCTCLRVGPCPNRLRPLSPRSTATGLRLRPGRRPDLFPVTLTSLDGRRTGWLARERRGGARAHR